MRKLVGILIILVLTLTCCACAKNDRYDLTESNFFYGMTVIQSYPSEYVGKDISFDCFTYRLTDVNGVSHLCGVRKCSSGYGCNCGKDTIIGFLLDYDGEIPEPKNQSEDTADKSWIHVEGTLPNANKEEIKIYAYTPDDRIDYDTIETIVFYHFKVSSLRIIEDYSGLQYYVTK